MCPVWEESYKRVRILQHISTWGCCLEQEQHPSTWSSLGQDLNSFMSTHTHTKQLHTMLSVVCGSGIDTEWSATNSGLMCRACSVWYSMKNYREINEGTACSLQSSGVLVLQACVAVGTRDVGSRKTSGARCLQIILISAPYLCVGWINCLFVWVHSDLRGPGE